MSELTPLREVVDTLADRALPPDFGDLKRRAIRRGRRRVALALATTAALIAGSALTVSGLDPDRRITPVEQPKPLVGAVPVWYDAKGLHHGDEVEQTPVELVEPEQVLGPEKVVPQRGALALVRSGALYLDPATSEVWFHPWGGEPRVVGHNSGAGPGGELNGDTAVWFEGSDPLNATPGDLVVYDTAAGREISRTRSPGVSGQSGIGGDHFPPGNGFLQVSAERVVWTSGPKIYVHDVRLGSTSEVKAPNGHYFADVHDDVAIVVERGSRDLVLRVPGRAEERYPDLESHVRLSPSGDYVLGVEATDERHAAAIVDTRTGELWRVPDDAYPWIAWSYGDMAMVDTEDELLACDPRRACERLPAERPFLMPTN